MNIAWNEYGAKLHEQTHIYWRTVYAFPVLIIGWGASLKGLEMGMAVTVILFSGSVHIFFTQALLKIYSLFKASVEELKIELGGQTGPFALEIKKLKVLNKPTIIIINIVLWLFEPVSICLKIN